MSECNAEIHDLIESPKEWSPYWSEAIKRLRSLYDLVNEWPADRRPPSPRHACRITRQAKNSRYENAHVVILVPGPRSWLPIFALPDGRIDVHPEIWDLLADDQKKALRELV